MVTGSNVVINQQDRCKWNYQVAQHRQEIVETTVWISLHKQRDAKADECGDDNTHGAAHRYANSEQGKCTAVEVHGTDRNRGEYNGEHSEPCPWTSESSNGFYCAEVSREAGNQNADTSEPQ